MRFGEPYWEFWRREVDLPRAREADQRALQSTAKRLHARFQERQINLKLLRTGIKVSLAHTREGGDA